MFTTLNMIKMWILVAFIIGLGSAINLNIGTPIQINIRSIWDAKFLELKLLRVNPKDLLIFDVKAVDKADCNANIYISKIHKTPSSVQHSWSCLSIGENICVIPSQNVKTQDIFFLGIYSKKNCKFSVSAYLRNQYELKDGVRIFDKLYANNTKMFKFFVPQDDTITAISVDLYFHFYSASGAKMVVIKSTNSSDTPVLGQGFPVIPTSFGYSTRISREHNKDFQTNSTYIILVFSPTNIEYELQYKTNKGIQVIEQEIAEFEDIVRERGRSCYQYKISNSSEEIEIIVNSNNENPNIYANPLSLPQRLDQFAFRSNGETEDHLILSSESRKEKGAPNGIYFICVSAKYYSSFTFSIFPSSSSPIRKLSKGIPRLMNYQNNQLLLFQYKLKEDQEDSNITFSLTSISGNSDLFVKFCKVNIEISPTFSCTLTKEDLSSSSVLSSKERIGIDVVRSEFNAKKCGSQNNTCFFLIGVLGVIKGQFSLIVIEDNNVEVQLQQGVPFVGYLNLKQTIKFGFTVENPSVNEVKIQLTSMSGSTFFYAAKFNITTGKFLEPIYEFKNSYLPGTISFKEGGNLATRYYVIVGGLTPAFFTLSYSTVLENESISCVQLLDGKPHNGAINSSHSEERAVYKFSLSENLNNDKSQVRIFISPITGSYQVFIGLEFAPNKTNYTWHFPYFGSNILLNRNDSKYLPSGKYFISVYKRFPENRSPHQFIIKYVSGNSPTVIMEGLPERGNLRLGNFQHYSFIVTNTSGVIDVTLTSYSGNPDLYISVSDKNPIPTENEHNYSSMKTGSDSISIPFAELKKNNKYCAGENSLSLGCLVSIAVCCHSEECSYVLQVSQNKATPETLLEGLPTYSIVANVPRHFLFPSSFSTKPTIINARSKIGKVKLYASVNCEVSSEYMNEYQFPTPVSARIVSKEQANSEVILINPVNSLSQCTILISVYHQILNESIEYSSFIITASSSLVWLIDGESAVDTVKEKSFKYYNFLVPCKLCVLSVSVVPLTTGDPDIYINKGVSLPSQSQHDFSSVSYRGDFIQISLNHSFFREQNQTSIYGDYTIGIYGYRNCTYSITATTTANLLKELALGVPTREVQNVHEMRYFKFYSWKRSNIKISLSLISGRAYIRANFVKNEKETDFLSKLPSSESSSNWTSLQQNSVNSILIPNEKIGNESVGIYLIGVETSAYSVYDIILEYVNSNEITHIQIGSPFRVSLLPNEKKRMGFILSERRSLKISLTVFSGYIEGKIFNNKKNKFYGQVTPEAPFKLDVHNSSFKISNYILELEAQQAVDVSVIVEQEFHAIKLFEGLPQSIMSGRHIKNFFIYEIQRERFRHNEEILVNINIKSGDKGIAPSLYVKLSSTKSAIEPTPENSNLTFSWDKDLHQISASFNVNNPERNSILILVQDISNEIVTMDMIQYEIMIFTSGIVLLQPNTFSLANTLYDFSAYQIYELNTEINKIFYVEVIPCVGEVEFFITKSLKDIYNKNYDVMKKELSKGKLFGSIRSTQGRYFVAIRAFSMSKFSGQNKQCAKYMIRAFSSEKNSAEDFEEDYSLEYYSRISYTLEGNNLELNWGKVLKWFSINEGIKYEIVTGVKYFVYLTEDKEANMISLCGIKANAQEIGSNLDDPSMKYNIEKHKQEQIILNVIAFLPNHDISMAYNPLIVQLASTAYGNILFYIFTFLIILMTGLATYFYFKLRKAERQIEFEMSDARNVREISSVKDIPSNKMEIYSNLQFVEGQY